VLFLPGGAFLPIDLLAIGATVFPKGIEIPYFAAILWWRGRKVKCANCLTKNLTENPLAADLRVF